MKINIKTEFPIAFDSPDHTHPWGTSRDNHTSAAFIREIEQYFGHKINFLDLGCAGGQLAVDFHKKGHLSVGLEGSDYSIKNKRANWPEFHNTVLFTCDISREYEIQKEDTILTFDLITAWEVVEHIHPDRLDIFLSMIHKHLKAGAIFVCSISTKSDTPRGTELHLSQFTKEEWISKIDTDKFEICPYFLQNKVREDAGSFWLILKKK